MESAKACSLISLLIFSELKEILKNSFSLNFSAWVPFTRNGKTKSIKSKRKQGALAGSIVKPKLLHSRFLSASLINQVVAEYVEPDGVINGRCVMQSSKYAFNTGRMEILYFLEYKHSFKKSISLILISPLLLILNKRFTDLKTKKLITKGTMHKNVMTSITLREIGL